MAHLYFNEDYPEVLTEFKRLCNADTSFYNLSAISDDIVANDYPVSRELYNKYTGNLRRAVDAVFSGDDADTDLALRLKAGVTRFGAFKAFNATQDIRAKGRTGAATAADDAENVEKRYNSFQAAEYATAASRARTAKQFAEYMTADRMRLFPNLRWLPSRSVEVRPEHRIFWNRVWPKTSDFWQKNQPGNLWNCKCDMEETDDPTDIPEKLNPKYSSASPGLKGNPAVTGKIFSDDCRYISKLKDTDRQYVESYVKPVLDRCEEYIKYKNDPNYVNVEFDWNSGGYLVIEKGHGSAEQEQNVKSAMPLVYAGFKVELIKQQTIRIDGKKKHLTTRDANVNEEKWEFKYTKDYINLAKSIGTKAGQAVAQGADVLLIDIIKTKQYGKNLVILGIKNAFRYNMQLQKVCIMIESHIFYIVERKDYRDGTYIYKLKKWLTD